MNLITGGTGLLGGHLVFRLLEEGKPVRLIIRSEESKKKLIKIFSYYSGKPDDFLKKIEWVYGDILDRCVLEEAFEQVENVYHCAAIVSFDRKDIKAMLETNIRGTAAIVNACLEYSVKKLVHVSSIAAIKNSTNGEMATENNQWPSGSTLNYAYSKTQGEFEVWRGINEGLPAVIVNPSVILGPGDWNNGSARFFSTVYNGLTYYTRGVTGFVDVTDVAKAMIQLMDSSIQAERFIISAENKSYEELFYLIAEALKVKRPSKYVSPSLTNLGWRLDYIRAKLFFSKPILTKDSARAAHAVQHYSSEKLKQAISFDFKPLNTSIAKIANAFLMDTAKVLL